MLRLILVVHFFFRLPGVTSVPNILLIMFDDVGYGDIIESNRHGATPFLTELAEKSTVLHRFYATPNCSPTRAALLTGRHSYRSCILSVNKDPLRNGNVSASGEYPSRYRLRGKTIGGWAKELGYRTAFFGKWHLGDVHKPAQNPSAYGFDTVLATTRSLPTSNPNCGCFPNTCPANHYHVDFACASFWDQHAEKYTARIHQSSAAFLADKVVDFVRSGEQTVKPWLATLFLHENHVPFVGEEGQSRDDSYFTALSHADDAISGLFQQLDLRNTLVLITSDNGPAVKVAPSSAGELRGSKWSLWEGGIRVPTLLYAPFLDTPKESWTPFSVYDLVPTLLTLNQVEVSSKTFDGVSLLPLNRTKRGKHIFVSLNNDWTLIGDRIKLIKQRRHFLSYNIVTDPAERHKRRNPLKWMKKKGMAEQRKVMRKVRHFCK